MFIAAHVSKWKRNPTSEDDSFPNQNSTPGRALSTSSDIGGFVFEAKVVRIWALKTHLFPFFVLIVRNIIVLRFSVSLVVIVTFQHPCRYIANISMIWWRNRWKTGWRWC